MSVQSASSSTSTRGPEGDVAGSAAALAAGISTPRLLAWMFGFLRPVKLRVFLSCLYLTLAVGVEVLTVKQTGRVVDYIQKLHAPGKSIASPSFRAFLQGAGSAQDGPTAAVDARHILSGLVNGRAGFSALMVGLVLVTFSLLVLRYLRSVADAKMSMMMVFYIREAVYDKLQRVGFGFHDSLSSGQLINRSLGDLQNVRSFIQTAVLTTLEIALIVVGYILAIVTISPWIALLALLPLPLWCWYIVRFSRRVQPAAKAVMEADDRNVSLITENIAGVHVVKAFATQSQEQEKYAAHSDVFLAQVRKRIALFANFMPVIRSIASGSYLTLFLAAGILMIKGLLRAGDFLILGQAMGQILGRLQGVAVINEQYQNAVVSGRRLYEVLHAPPTVPEGLKANPLRPGPGAVRFEHLTFGYTASKPVLHDISFEIGGGGIVAIVGPTGAGKTTLVNLLARFYDPQAGRILIDGIDIRYVTLASLRTQVAFVFQETYLFSDTVASNIAYGRPGTTDGEIEAAARLAQAHDFIEALPRGYQTVLGERGASLSGGQRQRLAIARAILFNPRILILDDATASIDPETESLIRRAMHAVLHGRTTFIIAHRISTVKQADLVVVLEDGRVSQLGTHDELLKQGGHYREIAAVQLSADGIGEPFLGHEASHMDRESGIVTAEEVG